jgi:quercetin dioxygenase-like cupin family protein
MIARSLLKIPTTLTLAAGALFGAACVLLAQQTSQRIPQFENDEVKVWKSVVLPHQPLTMHRHDHPRVIVALTSGTMSLVDSSGAKEDHVWEAGKAYWLPAMPPGAMHADVNVGDKPLEVMLIELEKAR